MAVSIVSKQYGDDSQAPIIDSSITDGSFSSPSEDVAIISSIDQDNFPIENTTQIQENTDLKQESTISSDENNDNGRLDDLRPEEITSPIEEKIPEQSPSETTIPNMYIKADTETIDVPADVAIFSEEKKKEDVGGFDMDDLLGDDTQETVSTQEETIVTNPIEVVKTEDKEQIKSQDPFVQTKEEIKEDKVIASIKKPLSSIAPKKSFIKPLAMAAAGLFGVVVIGFVVMTMFPAGIDWSVSQEVYEEEIIAQEPIVEEQHTVAEEKTPQEIAREELLKYSALWEEYYALWRDVKDRNMVRYALYVEKKAKDLIDMLDLDPNMDTKDAVVYFAQFDDYLKTLEDWKAGLGDTLPSPSNSTIVEEDMFNQPKIPFTDIQTNTADDTNTWSTQSGTLLTEPE